MLEQMQAVMRDIAAAPVLARDPNKVLIEKGPVLGFR